MLSRDDRAEVATLFSDALDLDPAARVAWLDARCGSRAELRAEVDSLLAAHEQVDSFLETPVELAAQVLGDHRAEPLVGRTAGPYTILSQLGAGGMGVVYLAHDARLGRKVALKLLPPHATRDAERLRRFQQEASAASRLNHPNILTIYEVGQMDSTHFIATEYIDGLTLRATMAQKPIGIVEALDAAIQVASALSAAHAAGIVHRDIKPENIMLRSDGYLKVLDFGIAKLTENPAVETHPGTVMGTVTYMSPEQARGLEVDARTDIWSLGVVLYEMVAGHVPFAGSNAADTLVAILEREAAPLTQANGGVPAELARVVSRTLNKDPGKRHSRIEDLTHDLRRIKQDCEFAANPRRSSEEETAAWKEPDPERPGIRANNLSTELRTIIGRDSEISAVEKLLRQAEVRLLTLTGPGGTGKTRLSQQVARGVLDDFADGVFIVPLAPIDDASLVASAIAQVLGVQQTRQRAFAQGLADYLRDKQMLLVLDNFEHVTAAAPLVGELLSASPRLKVLVTSRAALHVNGESEFFVPPLALPPTEGVQSAEALMRCGAAALFVRRVLAAKPQFAVTDENARTIAEICIRLDGLPLALELAASRTKLLSLEEILARMDHRLTLLKGGAKDLPARQQTMRATIAWSYDLLREDGKILFYRQSVFFGGSTLSAAEAVCRDINGVEIGVLDGLESLVDESLVLKKEMADGTYRFLMLETIREYAREHLAASGEEEALRRRHAHFFLELAEAAEPHLMSAAREPWLARLDAEHNNLRAALRWAADHGETEIGLRLVGALRWFWYYRGHIGEGFQWAESQLAMPAAAARTEARAKALFCAGSLAFYYSDPAAACPLLEESVALWRELGNKRELAYTLMFTSVTIHVSQLDFAAARAAAEESVALFRELDDRWGLALSLNYAGVILWTEPGAEPQAITYLEESVAIFRALGDGWGVGGAVLYLGALRQDHGDNAAARSLYEEVVALIRESTDTWRLASSLDILAELLRSEGDHSRAEKLTEESLILQRKLGKSLNLRKAWDHMKRHRQQTTGG